GRTEWRERDLRVLRLTRADHLQPGSARAQTAPAASPGSRPGPRLRPGPPGELRHLVEPDLGEVEVPARVTPDAVGAHVPRPSARQQPPRRRVHADAGNLIRH